MRHTEVRGSAMYGKNFELLNCCHDSPVLSIEEDEGDLEAIGPKLLLRVYANTHNAPVHNC